MRYIIFNVSNEYESLAAVIEWTEGRARLVRDRMKLAKETHGKDRALAWMSYFDSAELYERSRSVDEWIESVDQDAWENLLIVVTTKEPCFPDEDRVRVDATYLNVDERGCFWEIRPKYSDSDFETLQLTFRDHAELLEEES